MSFYSELADTARELLTEFGQPVQIRKYEVALPDPTTGIIAPPTVIMSTEVGALFDFEYRSFGESKALSSSVNATAKRLIVSAGTELSPGDSIVVTGLEYKIHVIKSVNPAGTKVLYDMWIQR